MVVVTPGVTPRGSGVSDPSTVARPGPTRGRAAVLPGPPATVASEAPSYSAGVPRTSARLSLLLTTAAVAVGVLAGCGGGSGPDGRTVTNQGGSGRASVSAPTSDASAVLASPSVGPSPVDDGSGTVSFAGVTVGSATTVGTKPEISSSASGPAPGLLVQDLVVGDGPAASPASTVSVHYSGVLYADGTPFDSDFGQPQPTSFPLDGVVPGFAQGIGGTAGVEPMKTGGRRLLVFPAALGYGQSGAGPIPAGASLVFVIDLVAVA